MRSLMDIHACANTMTAMMMNPSGEGAYLVCMHR